MVKELKFLKDVGLIPKKRQYKDMIFMGKVTTITITLLTILHYVNI